MKIKNLLPTSLAALFALSLGACSSNTANTPEKNNSGVDPLTAAVASGPVDEQDPEPVADINRGNYKVATPSSTPGVVVSPHKPYNLVGVKKYKSGDKVRDPYTKEIFLVP